MLGAFGDVRFCTHKKTGSKRAVKIIKKSFLKGKEEQRFLTEIEILKTMVIKRITYICRTIPIS
jgi:serine/threonine protein kinase